MDRRLLVELFQDGMQYPPGKHRFWVSRCFEITVRRGQVVELDEYEGFSADRHADRPIRRPAKNRRRQEMFHVGRSVLRLKEGRFVEEPGGGWSKNPLDSSKSR